MARTRKTRLKWPYDRKMTQEEFERHVESLKNYQTCLNCRHCHPIGVVGNYECDAYEGYYPLVIERFMPTGLYMGCKDKWEARE